MTRTASMIALGMLTLAIAAADTVRIRRNDVYPIVFDETLTLKNTRQGDTFRAHVDSNRELPRGTQFVGRVVRLRSRDRNRQASVELEFQTMILPDGSRHRIDAVPVNLNSRDWDRNGRFDSRNGNDRDKYVLGGALGGLVLGGAVKKPVEGAIVGAIAGVIVAQSNDRSGSFVRRGDRYGIMFQRDTSIEVRGSWNDRYRNDGWGNGRDDDWNRDRNNDRYRNDDWYRDEQNRDRDRYRDVEANCEFSYAGRPLRWNNGENPYRSGNTWMIPLLGAASQMGLLVDNQELSSRFIVEDDECSAILEMDKQDYRLNGRKRQLSRNIENRKGVIYVPVEVFKEMKGNEFVIRELN